VDQAVAKHSIRSDYELAIRSAQTDNLYKEVLLACALAPKNQLGLFTAGSIRDALEAVAGRRIEIPQFARDLKQFVLTGLSEGLISDDRLEALDHANADAATGPLDQPPKLF
jgi:hypothetical protein